MKIRRWLKIQAGLTGCAFRLIAGLLTANESAVAAVVADADRLHARWDGLRGTHDEEG